MTPPDESAFVQTVSGKGYRFVAPVAVVETCLSASKVPCVSVAVLPSARSHGWQYGEIRLSSKDSNSVSGQPKDSECDRVPKGLWNGPLIEVGADNHAAYSTPGWSVTRTKSSRSRRPAKSRAGKGRLSKATQS
jgi:hypothetical protein